MIDEEMAEEYIKKNNLEWELECNRTISIGEVKQAYLAGLKAGRPKWHDLRKNPNDLPLRRCIDSNGDVVGLFRHSWDKKPTWYRYDFHEREWWQMETEPIAWCEIPTYTEE